MGISLRVVVLLVLAVAGCGSGVEPNASAQVNGRIIVSELLGGGPCGQLSQVISYASDGTDRMFLTTSGSNIMPAAAPDG